MRTHRKDAMPAMPLIALLAVLPLSSCGLFAKTLGVSTDGERYRAVAATADGSLAGPALSPESLPPSAVLEAEVRDATGTARWRVSARGPTFAGPLLQEDALALVLVSVADDDVRGRAALARVEAP